MAKRKRQSTSPSQPTSTPVQRQTGGVYLRHRELISRDVTREKAGCCRRMAEVCHRIGVNWADIQARKGFLDDKEQELVTKYIKRFPGRGVGLYYVAPN